MDIAWLGHSCFRLRSDDAVVLTDPFPAALGLKPGNQPATVVTISNHHPNHCNWREVPGEPRVFEAPGEYECSGVAVRGVMTPLTPGTPREQRNVAYTIEIDGVHICHLGDIAEPLTPRLVDELSPADVLLVPAGAGCTLDLDKAAQTVQDLDPRIVVPMHYATDGVSAQGLSPVDAFLRLLGGQEVQPQNRLSVTTNNLPADRRLTVLTPQSRPA